ncbi:MAG: MoaA/NifB/PqqE/SkfB family radical SAM enzyme [Neolewinella sp.]|jgi:MoaA/NifB/PqqE/SkfB family radical SAM enzyme
MNKNNVAVAMRQQRILTDVTLELTYACNLDCFFCYNDRDKPGKPLSLAQYETLLRDLAGMQTMFLMLTGGEPMIHPHFFEIGRLTKELGFVVRVRTNGHSLTRAMARRVRDEVMPYEVEVSLHGATAEIHDQQTRVAGSFDRLVKNIASATDEGLRISVVSTPTSWNEHQIEAMFVLCDKLSVPLRFQGPVAPRDNGDTEPLTIQPTESAWDKVTRLVTERKQRQQLQADQGEPVQGVEVEVETKKAVASCGVGVAGVDIDPYGNVLACMHLQESAGNVHDHSISEIWDNSPLFARARSRAKAAMQQFKNKPIKQLGAPIFCLAVEENIKKSCGTGCGTGCGRRAD